MRTTSWTVFIDPFVIHYGNDILSDLTPNDIGGLGNAVWYVYRLNCD